MPRSGEFKKQFEERVEESIASWEAEGDERIQKVF